MPSTRIKEHPVESYLRALRSPASLRDEQKIADLHDWIEKTDDTDVLARVQMRQQLADAENPSIAPLEAAFVESARQWAQDNEVGAEALAAEGVPVEVLRRAGLAVRARSRGAGRGSGRRRGHRVTVADVRAAIPAAEPFTIQRLRELSGASPAVVRKVVAEDSAAGDLVQAGTDSQRGRPGRSPALYRRRR